MNKYFRKIKNYIVSRIDYYKTRRKLLKGDTLIASCKVTNNRCLCDQCDYEFEVFKTNEIINVVHDVQDKYDVKLKYEHKEGFVDDDFINNLKTIKILMWQEDYKRNNTKLEIN